MRDHTGSLRRAFSDPLLRAGNVSRIADRSAEFLHLDDCGLELGPHLWTPLRIVTASFEELQRARQSCTMSTNPHGTSLSYTVARGTPRRLPVNVAYCGDVNTG
jgi:hypothetical protein